MTDAIAPVPAAPVRPVQSTDANPREKPTGSTEGDARDDEFGAALDAALGQEGGEAPPLPASMDPTAANPVPLAVASALPEATGLDEATELAMTGGGLPLPTVRPEVRAALAAGGAETDPAGTVGSDAEAPSVASESDPFELRADRPGPGGAGVPGPGKASFEAVLERLAAAPPAALEPGGPGAEVAPQGAAELARVERPAPLQLDTRLPVQGPRFADGMGQQIVVLAQHGIQQARMSLSPPEIGPVDVRITIANDEASVQLAAPTALARDAIQDALPKLREMMEQSGLRLQDAGVYAQLPQREQSGFGRQRDDGAPPSAPSPPFVDELDAPTTTVRQLGLVDAYA